MTILETDKIDSVTVHPGTGRTELIIVDDVLWESREAHWFLLQQKISTYLVFIESGQLQQDFPSSDAEDVAIVLTPLHRPDDEGLAYICRLARDMSEAGYEFSVDLGSVRSEAHTDGTQSADA